MAFKFGFKETLLKTSDFSSHPLHGVSPCLSQPAAVVTATPYSVPCLKDILFLLIPTPVPYQDCSQFPKYLHVISEISFLNWTCLSTPVTLTPRICFVCNSDMPVTDCLVAHSPAPHPITVFTY